MVVVVDNQRVRYTALPVQFNTDTRNLGVGSWPYAVTRPDAIKFVTVGNNDRRSSNFGKFLLNVAFDRITHHTFTVPFQAQNSPFPQIFSTIVS